jgi:hypothetical protein
MSSKSDYLENLVLDAVFNSATLDIATLYIGLFTATPSDSGGGTEVSTGGGTLYARVNCSASFPAAASGAISNDVAITFPESGAAWGTVTSFGFFDASTVGNLLYWGPLGANRVVDGAGITVTFPIGDIDITES